MEKLVVNILSDEALTVLKEMEQNKKIVILNEAEVKEMKARRERLLNEIDNYTYDSIMKSLKDTES